jgi:hypothetical protein
MSRRWLLIPLAFIGVFLILQVTTPYRLVGLPGITAEVTPEVAREMPRGLAYCERVRDVEALIAQRHDEWQRASTMIQRRRLEGEIKYYQRIRLDRVEDYNHMAGPEGERPDEYRGLPRWLNPAPYNPARPGVTCVFNSKPRPPKPGLYEQRGELNALLQRDPA